MSSSLPVHPCTGANARLYGRALSSNAEAESEPMSDLLLIERRGKAAILTLNRPQKHNALSSELLKALEDALRELDDDADVRGIVLTGNDRAFSTGADLGGAVQASGPLGTARLLAFFAHTNTIIEELSKPVVAAINGYCLTGGLEVALGL